MLFNIIILNANEQYNEETLQSLKSEKFLENLSFKLNRKLPIMMDNITLYKANVNKNAIIYYYTYEKKSFPNNFDKNLMEDVCQDNSTGRLLSAKFKLEYIYHDKNGKELRKFTITNHDCLKLKKNTNIVNVDKKLINLQRKLNTYLPKKLNKNTIAEKVTIQNNLTIVYTYKLIKVNKDRFEQSKQKFLEVVKKNVCTGSLTKSLLDKNYKIKYLYI